MSLDERPDLLNTHEDVMEDVVESTKSVALTVPYLNKIGFECYMPIVRTAAKYEERDLFRDHGDIFVRKPFKLWRRLEVKHPKQWHWTCADDCNLPKGLFFSKPSLIGTNPIEPTEFEYHLKPCAWIVFNDTTSHFGVVRWEHRKHWTVEDFVDWRSGAPGKAWSCPIKYVEFVPLDLENVAVHSLRLKALAAECERDDAFLDDDFFGVPGPAVHGNHQPRRAVPERAAAR